MSKDIKKIGIPIAAIAVALVLIAPAMLSTGAFAIDPIDTTRDGDLHFVGSPQLTVDKTDGATLTATGDVAGAGTDAGTATLSADVSATAGCINPPGNKVLPGQEDVSTTVTATATFEPTSEGSAEYEVTTEPLTIEDFDFECPSAKMTETLVGAITFSDPALTMKPRLER